jgi:hypothetical protein
LVEGSEQRVEHGFGDRRFQRSGVCPEFSERIWTWAASRPALPGAESYAADTSKNVRSITRGHLVSVEFIDRRGQAQRREGFWVGSSPPALGSQVRASYNPVGGKIEQPITTLSEAGSLRYLFGLAFGLFVFAFAWLCVRLTLRRGAPQP